MALIDQKWGLGGHILDSSRLWLLQEELVVEKLSVVLLHTCHMLSLLNFLSSPGWNFFPLTTCKSDESFIKWNKSVSISPLLYVEMDLTAICSFPKHFLSSRWRPRTELWLRGRQLISTVRPKVTHSQSSPGQKEVRCALGFPSSASCSLLLLHDNNGKQILSSPIGHTQVFWSGWSSDKS